MSDPIINRLENLKKKLEERKNKIITHECKKQPILDTYIEIHKHKGYHWHIEIEYEKDCYIYEYINYCPFCGVELGEDIE